MTVSLKRPQGPTRPAGWQMYRLTEKTTHMGPIDTSYGLFNNRYHC